MPKKMNFWREMIKWFVVAHIFGLSALHIMGNKAIWAPLDAYCPFGGFESLWNYVSQGKFLEKTQPSNLALGIALVLTTLLFGGLFCGWICPLGTIQDGLNRLGRFLRLPQIKISSKADKILRWMRFPILFLVLLETLKLAKLWFADYDPFRIIFGLHWIAEPSGIVIWGWIIGVGFIVMSLVIRRFWCKYLCPLGLIIQGLSMISWFRIRWKKSECSGCNLCSKKCPLGLAVQNSHLNSTACNNCLECVVSCPKPGALEYRAPFGAGIWVTLTGVGFFALLLIGAQIIGWWNPKITGNPEDIKGWMTLGSVAENYHIPISEIKKELQLPSNATADTELRSFEKTVSNFEMDHIRNYIASRIGSQKTENGGISAPVATKAENATPEPVVTNVQSKNQKKETVEIVATPVHSSEKAVQSQREVRDPEEIRGTMTLAEVSEGWQIPIEVLLEKLGLPKDVDTKAQIRNLENYGISGLKVREAVRGILK